MTDTTDPTPHDAPTRPSPLRTVALVGHCGFDSGTLKRFAASALPDAKVVSINKQSRLDEAATPQTLWLVNRVLDGRFNAAGGIEMIEQYASQGSGPRMMLISNFQESQEAAEAAGALRGFGKSEVGSDTALRCLKDAAGE